MYTTIKMILVLGILVLATVGEASEYSDTLSMCRAFSDNNNASPLTRSDITYSMSLQSSKVFKGASIGFKNIYQGAKTALTLDGFGVSPETKELLSSEGYFQALKDCFGDFTTNRYAWDSFTLMIILSDAAGQSLAYVGSAVFSIGAVNKTLQVIKYGFKLLSATPYLAAHPAITSKIFLAGKVGTVGYVLKTQYDSFNNIAHPENQINKDILEKQIPELQTENEELLAELEREIQKEKSTPVQFRNMRKIQKLTNLYKARKEKHLENMQKLRDITIIPAQSEDVS